MKFGIFVFGDNPPEIGRSNQKYYEEVLTMAEWAEDRGFDSLLARRASLLLVRHLCLATDDYCSTGAAHQENPPGTGHKRSTVSPSAHCG